MPRRVLDTNILINFWGRKRGNKRAADISTAHARRWARELIDLRDTQSILTPIYLEYVCGKCTEHEVELARIYLGEFDLVDNGEILQSDWDDAKRIAHRVPKSKTRRQMGDCLIRAICDRLRFEVITADRHFPD